MIPGFSYCYAKHLRIMRNIEKESGSETLRHNEDVMKVKSVRAEFQPSDVEMLKRIHELEMQNEELLREKEQLEIIFKKHTGLSGFNQSAEYLRFNHIEYTEKTDQYDRLHHDVNNTPTPSGHKKLKEKLRESEQRYQLLIETANDGILVAQGQYLKFVNPMMVTLTGYNEEELKSIPFLECIHYDDRELLKTNYHKRLKGESVTPRYQFRLIKKDKSIKWFELSGVRIEWEGQPATLDFITDITERKKAEEALMQLNKELEDRISQRTTELVQSNRALQQSEEKFRLLFDKMTNGFCLLELMMDKYGQPYDIRVLEINEKAASHFNLKPVEIINKTIRELFSRFDPENNRNTIQVALTGKPVSFEKYCNATGNRLKVYMYSPQKYRVAAISEDITERILAEETIKINEERLQKLLDSVTDYVYKVHIKDKRVIKTIHGEGCKAITGYSVSEFCENNLLWYTIVYDDDKELVKKIIEKLLENQAQLPFEHRIVHKNGSVRWIRNTIVLRQSSEGELIGYDGLISDITKTKELEQLLLTSVIDTEERERLHFSQELHDGIGPLLSSIKILMELLSKPNSNNIKNEILGDIAMLLDESLRTVREISFRLSPHMLQNCGIEGALKAFIAKVNESSFINIELKTENLYRFDEKIETISYRVLCECINNTIKHANANNIIIDLRCHNDMFLVEYRDDGRGFDVEYVMSGNKGIGLLNIRSRIRSINGSIDFTSIPGKGTTVSFQIKTHKN